MSYILLAEDDRDILLMIQRKLELSGYNAIWTTSDGQAALEQALAEMPFLLILDIMLPNLDGLSICAEVKNYYGADAPPVVLVSARGQKEHLAEGRAAGADAYIIKPFSPRDFMETIEQVLGR